MNFVPCVTWIRKGLAKETPEKVQLTKEELQQLIEETRKELGGADLNDDSDGNEDSTAVDETDDIIKKYDLQSYDDENEVSLGGFADLAMFSSNKDDPLLTQRDDGDGSDEDDDFCIKPTDNLIAVGHVEGDASILEIYVYNEDNAQLYVHHDIMLPAFPLALEYLSYNHSEEGAGNYLAVGDMTPVIRVWDLDLVDALEPVCKLGRKPKKTNKEHFGHKDAVLCLSWNRDIRNVLASGSADNTVLLWDLNSCRPSVELTGHSDKVQTVEFHPFESSMLLSGSCDSYAILTDCRTEEINKKWTFGSEVEKVLWNHFDPFYFLVSTEDGMVHYVDVRMSEKLFSISAHHKAITGLALSSQCPGCLLTVSVDRTLKIWDIAENKAEFVIEKKPKLGALYCVAASPDSPFVVAMGGDKRSDNFKVWDIRQSAAARKRFSGRLLQVREESVADRGVEMDEEPSCGEDESYEQGAMADSGAKPKKKKKRKRRPKS